MQQILHSVKLLTQYEKNLSLELDSQYHVCAVLISIGIFFNIRFMRRVCMSHLHVAGALQPMFVPLRQHLTFRNAPVITLKKSQTMTEQKKINQIN